MTILGAAHVARLQRLVATRFGLSVEAAAARTVLVRRAGTSATAVDRYLERAEVDAREPWQIAGDLTIGETYFHRHVEQLDAYREVALPERLAATAGTVRVLSAGCSSGEEPYTLAMLAHELSADAAGRVAVTGIDLDQAALDRAARARYSRWSLRTLPPELEARWFRPEGRDHVLAPALRDRVTFARANLLDAARALPAGSQDIVFCRNVLMYFTAEAGARVLAGLVRSLAPGGYLFLGHVDIQRAIAGELALCHTHGAFYYRRTGRQAVVAVAPVAVAVGDVAELMPEVMAEVAEPPTEHDEVELVQAVAWTEHGDHARATAACRDLVMRGQHVASAHYLLALIREAAGDPLGAAHFADLACAADPSFAMAHLLAAQIARRARDELATRAAFQRARDAFARDSDERLALHGGGLTREQLIAVCTGGLAIADAQVSSRGDGRR